LLGFVIRMLGCIVACILIGQLMYQI
jgi:hypothetical protein